MNMEIEVKGHSGCKIELISEDSGVYIYKSSNESKYIKRLALQAQKQQNAYKKELRHIRVPKIYAVHSDQESTCIKMEYIYSKNFIDFFELAGFGEIHFLIEALQEFIEYEINCCTLQKVSPLLFTTKFDDIQHKVEQNPFFNGDNELTDLLASCRSHFYNLSDMEIPVGLCHGDLTFSNILFSGNNYFLIDFLDNFIETPLQDIVKIRQDTVYHWSELMFKKEYDSIRLHIIYSNIDKAIDTYFSDKYSWYTNYYRSFQLMNLLRILPYAHEKHIVEFLKKNIKSLLYE